MYFKTVIIAVVIISMALASCVSVTTARKAEAPVETTGGERGECSGVKVRTYGWNVLETALDILLFPFKIVYHAVKTII